MNPYKTIMVNIGQLFVRKPLGFKRKNTYLVCGIIQTEEPLETEAIHTIRAGFINHMNSRDVSVYSKGNNLDGIMTTPLWQVKITDD